MYKVIDKDWLNPGDEISTHIEYFNSLKEVYDYVLSQYSKEFTSGIRLKEDKQDMWVVEVLSKFTNEWWQSLSWTVEKVEDNELL